MVGGKEHYYKTKNAAKTKYRAIQRFGIPVAVFDGNDCVGCSNGHNYKIDWKKAETFWTW